MTATTPATTRRRIPLPSFGAQILLALVLGLALGYLARTAQLDWLTNTLDTVGSLFVQLLKLAVPPPVFTAIVASILQPPPLTTQGFAHEDPRRCCLCTEGPAGNRRA